MIDCYLIAKILLRNIEYRKVDTNSRLQREFRKISESDHCL